MKQCPTCQSIVEASTECPICGATLTYVDPHPAHREKIARNWYAVRYYVGKAWFACACTAAAIVLLFCAEWHHPLMTVMSLLCCAAALVRAFCERWLLRRWGKQLLSRDFHTDEYRKVSLGADKYLIAALAVMLALVPYLIR